MAGTGSADFAQRVIEADIREELEAHLGLATASGVDEGMTPQEARARALARFGNLEQTVRDCSRQKLGGWLMWKRVTLVGALAALVLGAVLTTFVVRARQARTENEWAFAAMLQKAQEPQEIIVRIGDRIELHEGYGQLSGSETYDVDRDGTALLPVLGHVDVAGLTRAELEVLLRELYSPYYDQLDLYARVLGG